MKKTILSIVALFAVAAVSAQSYPKQPDKTIVEYTSYEKAAPAKAEVKEQPADTKSNGAQAQPARDRKVENTSNELRSSTAVTVNEEKNSSKKSQ